MMNKFGIITAADNAVINGLRLMLESLRWSYPVAVTNLGLSQKHLQWLESHNVLILEKTGPASPPIYFWQAWNKPFYIINSPFRQTLWMDTDTLAVKKLDPIIERISNKPFVVRNGSLTWRRRPFTADVWPFYEKYPVTHRLPEDIHINAGVLGFDLLRDGRILNTWAKICKDAIEDKEIYSIRQQELEKHGKIISLRAGDEPCLRWTIERLNTHDMVVYNSNWNHVYDSPGLPTMPSRKAFLRYAYRKKRKEDIILHFVGRQKIWRHWVMHI